jgi:hypothetical protein
VTVSIRQTLATLETGATGVPLSWRGVGNYLRDNCDTDTDRAREKRHRLRDELYRDGGTAYLKEVISSVYGHREIVSLRQAWAQFARFNNAIKRIVNEISTLYTAPAERHVGGGEDNDRRYQDVLEQLLFDEQMQEASRMYNLHRTILVGPRVRVLPDDSRDPVLDIVTPSTFRVVLHPNDNKFPVGYLIRTDFRSARSLLIRKPAWELWTDHERIYFDEEMNPIESTLVEHGLGMNRWVPVTRSPMIAGFWPGEEGEDLVAAHVAIAFANILLLKETKSATKWPVATGDLSGAARGQMMDTEGDGSLPPETALQVHDMSMDPEQFTQPADHVLERCANNYGLSMALLSHQGVQSAEAREAMRIPIRELRRAQQPMFRSVERRLARVIAAVLQADAADVAFDAVDWRIDFGESQTPLSEREEVDLFLKKRGALLDDTVAFEMRRNPDIDETAAWAAIEQRVLRETKRIERMRDMQALSGGPDDSLEDDNSDADPPEMRPTEGS